MNSRNKRSTDFRCEKCDNFYRNGCIRWTVMAFHATRLFRSGLTPTYSKLIEFFDYFSFFEALLNALQEVPDGAVVRLVAKVVSAYNLLCPISSVPYAVVADCCDVQVLLLLCIFRDETRSLIPPSLRCFVPKRTGESFFPFILKLSGSRSNNARTTCPPCLKCLSSAWGMILVRAFFFMYHSPMNFFILTDMANYHAMIHLSHESAYRGLFEPLP